MLFEGVITKLKLNQNYHIKKIALTGPESTGKTTLCAALAAHFKTVWVPEMSRDYIGGLNRKYTLEDIEACTRAQLNEEEALLKRADKFLFCDSDMIIAKVWCEDVFKFVPEWRKTTIYPPIYRTHILILFGSLP